MAALVARKNLPRLLIVALLGSLVTILSPLPSQAVACTTSQTTFVSGSTNYGIAAVKSGSACTWSVPTGVTSVSILALGGGGGGASRHGGGGSAGKFVEDSRTVASGDALTISIGAGGAGASGAAAAQGSAGSQTTVTGTGSFVGITATGGSGGLWTQDSAARGYSGNGFRSGLGGSNWYCTGTTSGWCGGGGAGSTADGENADNGNNNRAGNGGAGSTATLYSSSVASTLGISTQVAGGGGGGADDGGTAGTASFGAGAGSVGAVNAASATVNTGAGGGGSGYVNTGGQGNGGDGGSGLVVIRWVIPSGSVALNGSSQWLSVPSSTDWNIGTGDFTVEWFQYQTGTSTWPRVFTLGSYPNTDLGVSIEGGTVYVWVEGAFRTSYSLGVTSNYFHKWVHFALTRSAGTLNLYYEGTRVATVANTSDIQTGSNPLLVGSEGDSSTSFPGYLSNFHFVKGTALYSGVSLTRPSAPIVAVANTKLLLNFTDSANLLTDSSGTGKTVTNVGISVWDANNPFSVSAPNAPTLNSATAAGGGANLSWSIPSYNGGSAVTNYEYELNASGTWTSTGSTDTTYSITGLTPGTSYSVKVRAVNSVGAGAESGSLSFTPTKSTTSVGWPTTPTSGYVISGSATLSRLATSTSDGVISYSIYNAGTTGCSLDVATRVLSYTAAGSCTIRATVAETATYFSAFRDFVFTVNKSTQTVTWAPNTSFASNTSPQTMSAQAAALGSATISYAVTSAGTTGCTVDATTGELTFTSTGTCTVRASSATNATYLAGYRDVNFVISAPTSYTITYNYNNATAGNGTANAVFTVGGSALSLPTPTRTSYVFDGWYDANTGGTKVGAAGASYTPAATRTLYARWVQRSLWGMGSATKIGTITTVAGVGNTFSASGASTSVSMSYLADALPAGTVLDVYLVADTSRAAALITSTSSFVVNLVVAWKATDETVPSTATGKPLTMTITNPAIKRGQHVYSLLGDTVLDLGIATADGSVTFQLTDDPEIVIANTKPDAPTSVSGNAGDARVTVNWSAPSSNGGTTITGYTVTANTGATCTSATTSCEFTGLTNGTAYTFTVVATNAVGNSSSSVASAAVTPAAPAPAPSGGGGGGGGAPATEPVVVKPYEPTLPQAPTASEGAAVIVGGSAVTAVVQLDATRTAVVVQVSGSTFESKIVSPAGETVPQQTLALTATAGDELHFTGSGLKPGTELKIYAFSTPTFLGVVTVGADGKFIGKVVLPPELAAGEHTLQFGGYLADGKIIATSYALILKAKQVVVSKTVKNFFAVGSYVLGAKQTSWLQQTVSASGAPSSIQVKLVGFVQSPTSTKKELILARARALAVARYVKSLGVTSVVIAKGGTVATETDWRARRTEAVFTYTK